MSAPCPRCGAARGCEHREAPAPRVLNEAEKPKVRGPGRPRKTEEYFDVLTERGTAYAADRFAARQEA